MCFILCIPTLAYEQTENAAIGIDEFISIYLEEISPNEEAMAVVRQEAELLNKFLGLDGVSIKITEDDKTYVYEKVFPNDVVDYIRVGQDDKGVITFNISEDGIQDTVKFDKNGDIYVNGNKVVISSTNGFDSEQTIVPQTSTVVEHSLIPFAGTMTYQYSQLLYSHKCANINAGSVIGSLTVTAITMIISKAVVSIFASPIAGDAVSLFRGSCNRVKNRSSRKCSRFRIFFHIIIVNTNIGLSINR